MNRPAAPRAERAPNIVTVPLGARSYDIIIGRGVVASLGERIAAIRPGAKAAVVTDEAVAGLHLPAVTAALGAAGIASTPIVVPQGEGSKDYETFRTVCEGLIAARIERNDIVVAFGGGVIGDLAGFASASVRRGIDCVQVPTTLLSQVDSSVGGKTGINSPQGKNLIGAFHQPLLVVADTALLDTLPQRQFTAGYAEVVKYGLINDVGLFSWLEQNWREIFSGGPARDDAVALCCRSKAQIVERDEREMGDRALLNLGHTFGHAFEAAAGYSDRLLHGEAVSLGMALALEFSARKGFMSMEDARRAIGHLSIAGLPTTPREIAGGAPDATRMMVLMGQDKKVARGQLVLILARGLGEAFIAQDVDPEDLRTFLTDVLAR